MIKLNHNPQTEDKDDLEINATDRCLLRFRHLSGAAKLFLFACVGVFAVGLQIMVASTAIARWGVFGVYNGYAWFGIGALVAVGGLFGTWLMIRPKG